MPEPMDSATETAKAVQEVAKATGKAIDLVRDIGPLSAAHVLFGSV
jgi:hypothetical protein